MGKSMNLNNLTPEEAEKILEVIQKDFELRQKDKERLSAIEEVVNEEENKTTVLTKQNNFNRNCCIRCCQTFGFIFNRKTTCLACKLFVCKSCCQYDDSKKAYTCRACLAEEELKLKSCEWFYDHVGARFKRFGSAKVVRSLYKQASSPRNKFHWSDGDEAFLEETEQCEDLEEERADNESDSGYDPSLYSSFGQSGSSVRVKSRPSLTAVFPQIKINDEDGEELDNGLIPPPLIPPPSPPNNNNNTYKDSPNTSLENIQMAPRTPPTTGPRMLTTPTQTSEGLDNQNVDKKDIYKEAFENSKRTEEAKFKIRFDNLLLEMQQSIENISPRDNRVPSNYGTTSYGDLMTAYRQRVKDMLVSLSQRLELAVESFDETCAHSPNLTSQKVRQIISKLVEDRLGESLDLTSDEAVSDLSSLSDDSSEQKSYEEQIAQAVLARVLEIHRNQTGVHLNLDELLDQRQSDSSGVEDKLVDKTIDSSVGEEHALIDTVDKGIGTDTSDIRGGIKSTHEIGVETDDSGIVNKKAKQTKTKTPQGSRKDSKGRDRRSQSEEDLEYESDSRRDRSGSKSKRKETNRSAQRKNTYTKDDREDSYDDSEEIDDNTEDEDETFEDESEERRQGDIRPKRSSKLEKVSKGKSAPRKQRQRDIDINSEEGDDYVDGASNSEEKSDESEIVDDESIDEYSDSEVPKGRKSDKHRIHSTSDKIKTQKDKRRKSSGLSENETQKEKRRKSSESSDYETQKSKRRTKSSGDSESDIAQTPTNRRRKSSDRKSTDRKRSDKNRHHSDDTDEADENAESDEEIVDEKALLQNEFERLRTFARDCNPRPLFEERKVEEEVEPEDIEEEIEPENVDHEESQEEFASRMFTFDRVNDPENRFLPDFSDLDYEYHDFGIDEVDPDLLSMNLCPILEETEEELEDDKKDVTEYEQDWKGNWIFKGAGGINPYSSFNKSKRTGEFGDVTIMVPMPNEDWSPQVGEENIDDVSDLSENEDINSLDGLSDEEHTFYAKTSEEIARITRKPRSDRSSFLSNSAHSGVQTDGESDADSAVSRPLSLSLSDIGSKTTEHSVNSSQVSEKAKVKLSEDLVPSETGDPKFEIPPISTTVPEGEPAKFTCRVSGTQPFDVFWYKVGEEVEELENSENFEIVKDGNRHHLTMYNMTNQDAGQYMCMVMNEKGRCCQYFILGTKKNTQELKAPEFLKSLLDVEVKEGQSVKFRCKVKGYPQPRVVWYKDGQILLNQLNYKLERFGNRDYILAIETASMDEDAEYSVLAKNIAGECRSSAQLIVEPKNKPESLPKPKEKSPAKIEQSKQGESLSPNYLNLSYLKKGRSADTSATKAKSPSEKKDEQNLSNIGKKVSMTRNSVTEVAEDMLTSSKELTEIDQSIAAMDKILEDLETDLGCSVSSDDLDSVNELDLDPINDITCLTALDNFVVLQNAADKVRTVTSMTQNYLDKTDSIVQDQKLSEDFATSTPRSSESERAFNPDVDTSHILCDTSDLTKNSTKIPMSSLDSSDDSHKSDVQFSVNPLTINMDSKKDNSLRTEPVSPTNKSVTNLNKKPDNITIDLKTDTTMPSQNDEWFEVSEVQDPSSASTGSGPTSPNTSSDNLVVNLGPKRENKERYSRDFYITNTPQLTRKTPPTSPREEEQRAHTENKIYLSASNVYNLENKVQTLQDKMKAVNALQEQDKMAKLENQVAQTAAKVATSESHVKNIEQSVNQLKKATPGIEVTKAASPKTRQAPSAPRVTSPPREKPEPTFLKGSTSEQDLPESRTEFNDEYGAIELPSVNRLKAMFGGNGGGSSPKSGASVKRVHSITARSVPKGQLEKLKKTGVDELQPKLDNTASSDSTHKASSDPVHAGRATALTTGQQIKQMPNAPKQVYQSSDFKSSQKTAQVEKIQTVPSPSIKISSYVKDSKTGSQIKSKQTVQVQLTTDNTNKPLNSSQLTTSTQKLKQPIKSSGAASHTTVISEDSKQKNKTGNEIDTPDERKSPRIKHGAISAMSKFWEKKLNESDAEDQAPEILEYN